MSQQLSEIWKDVAGFEGKYQISNKGNLKRLLKVGERLKKLTVDKDGYLVTMLCNKSIRKNYFIHRLVATAFIQNPEKLKTVNHIDEVKTNNSVENLEWMSFGDNARYTNKRPITQLDMNGKEIAKYDAIQDVKRELGFDTGFIAKCCMGNCNSAYGYKWIYQ